MSWELLWNLHPDVSLAFIGTALGLGALAAGAVGGVASAVGRKSPTDILGQNPINPADLQTALSGNKDALQRQRDFISALSGQNGIQNQSNVFGQQQGLANQLQAESLGGGPNPAGAQLALTTGQNINNQAALLAGQRGVGANPGLAARQIGQIGGNLQQQAVGQGAVLRANQQLAAQQQLQQQQAILASLSGQQVAQQQSAISGLNNQQSDFLRALLGGQANYNQQAAGIEQQNQAANSQLWGSLIGAGGTLAAGALMPKSNPIINQSALGSGGTVSSGSATRNPQQPMYSRGGKVNGKAKTKGDSKQNDTVPAMLSPGEVVIPRSKVKDPKKVAAFINATLGMNLKVGK